MNRTLTHSILYGLATIVPRALGFLLLPLYTRYLSPADYGLIATIDIFSTYFGLAVNAGFSNALLRYYYEHDNDAWRRSVYTTTVLSVAGLSFALVILIVGFMMIDAATTRLFASEQKFVLLAALTVGIEAINMITWTLFRLQERAPRALFVTLIRAAIAIPLNVVFIAIIRTGVLGFFISNLLVAFVILATFGLAEAIREWAPPRVELIRGLTQFSLPYIPVGVIEALVNNLGVISLDLTGSLTAVGLFAMGSKIASIVTFAYVPIGAVWTPMMYKHAQRLDASDFFGRGVTYIALLNAAAAVAVVALGPKLLKSVTPDSYSNAMAVIVPLSIAYSIYSLRISVRIGFTLAHKTAMIPYFTLMPLAVFIPITLLFSHFDGLAGAATGMSFVMVSTVLVAGWAAQRHFRIHYEWDKLIKIYFALAACTGLAYFTNPLQLWLRLGVLGCFPILIFFSRVISISELTQFFHKNSDPSSEAIGGLS